MLLATEEKGNDLTLAKQCFCSMVFLVLWVKIMACYSCQRGDLSCFLVKSPFLHLVSDQKSIYQCHVSLLQFIKVAMNYNVHISRGGVVKSFLPE